MSWGTYYKYNGYLSRISKNQVDEEIEECDSIIDAVFREILVMVAMTPPATAKDCEGNEYPWHEYAANKIKELRDQLEDSISTRTRLLQCQEVMKENPEDVEEG